MYGTIAPHVGPVTTAGQGNGWMSYAGKRVDVLLTSCMRPLRSCPRVPCGGSGTFYCCPGMRPWWWERCGQVGNPLCVISCRRAGRIPRLLRHSLCLGLDVGTTGCLPERAGLNPGENYCRSAKHHVDLHMSASWLRRYVQEVLLCRMDNSALTSQTSGYASLGWLLDDWWQR